MPPKTKTGSLIRQLSQTAKLIKPNPQIMVETPTLPTFPTFPTLQNIQPEQSGYSNLLSNQKTSHRLALSYFGIYNVFSLFFEGIDRRSQHKHARSLSQSRQNCALQKQNFRLIQANLSLLSKFVETIHTLRNDIIHVLQLVEMFQYVNAVQMLYGILDKIRKIDDQKEDSFNGRLQGTYLGGTRGQGSENNVGNHSREFPGGLGVLKRELTSMKELSIAGDRNSRVLDYTGNCDSVVQQYSQNSQSRLHQEFKSFSRSHPTGFQISLGISTAIHIPEPGSPSRCPSAQNIPEQAPSPPPSMNKSSSIMQIRRKPYKFSTQEIEEEGKDEVEGRERSRSGYSSDQCIQVFGSRAGRSRKHGEVEKQDLYRMLVVQACSLEYVITDPQ